MTRQADLDAYARVTLDRVQRAIEAQGGIATTLQMERMRECYTQLHRDNKLVCARRLKEI